MIENGFKNKYYSYFYPVFTHPLLNYINRQSMDYYHEKRIELFRRKV